MREQGWKQDRENVRWGQFSGFEKCMGNGRMKQPYPNPRSKHDSNQGQISIRFRLSQIRVRQNFQCRSQLLIPHHFSNPDNSSPILALPRFDQCNAIRRCINPCAEHPCAPSAHCRAVNHRAICTCPDGYIGSPTTSCRPREYTEPSLAA